MFPDFEKWIDVQIETPTCVTCIFSVQQLLDSFVPSDFLWTQNYPRKKLKDKCLCFDLSHEKNIGLKKSL